MSSPDAYENWKALRLLGHGEEAEDQLSKVYNAIAPATRTQLAPPTKQYLKSHNSLPEIRDRLRKTASYRLDERIGARQLPSEDADPDADLQDEEYVLLETLQDHIAAARDLLNATRIEVDSPIRVLITRLKNTDPESKDYLEGVLKEWSEEREPWEGEGKKLAELQRLLENCENSRQRQARLREEYNMGRSWVGGWSFSVKGAMGDQPMLWTRQDLSGKILDRCVIKNTYRTSSLWSQKLNRFWYDPLDPNSEITAVYSEIAAMAALRGREDSAMIVGLRNWRMFHDQLMYRVYLEFCPHGDLYQWTYWYSEQRKKYLHQRNNPPVPVKPDMTTVTKEKLRKYTEEVEAHLEYMKTKDPIALAAEFHKIRANLERPYLPEPFLWHTFECMARAGRLMEQPAAGDRWELILHLDYKPSNIFLALPDAKHYKGYPVPKLGDFGFAKLVPRNDTAPTFLLPSCGTPSCRPREQTCVFYKGEKERRRMDAKTNVWGVGIVMWSLMELEPGDHRLFFDDEPDAAGNKYDGDTEILDEPTFRPKTRQHYSKKLRALVSWCLKHEQKDRPSFEHILMTIKDQTWASTGQDLANGLRAAEQDDPRWQQDENLLVSLKQDMFKGYLTDLARPPNGMDDFPSPPSTEDAGDDVPGEAQYERRNSQRLKARNSDENNTSRRKRSASESAQIPVKRKSLKQAIGDEARVDAEGISRRQSKADV